MRPNWFIAFPVGGRFVLDLPAPPAGFRSFAPEDVHLTLTWLGGCAPATAERAFGLLEEHLKHRPLRAMRAVLGEVVPMGASGASYSALSALLTQGKSDVERAMQGAGRVPLEALTVHRLDRTPTPHVTLARPTRRATEAQRKAGRAWARAIDLGSVEVTLDHVALYTWSPKRNERLFWIVKQRGLD